MMQDLTATGHGTAAAGGAPGIGARESDGVGRRSGTTEAMAQVIMAERPPAAGAGALAGAETKSAPAGPGTNDAPAGAGTAGAPAGAGTNDAPAGAGTGIDLAGLATERLEAEIVGLSGRLESGTFELLVLVGELDARGSWARAGSLSCAAWLASHCDVEPSTAANQVRVARAMREHPELLAAMRSGDVSYAKARILVPHLARHHVEELVALASRTPSGRLGMEIARWSQKRESPEEVEARHQAERSVSWRTDADGMVTVTTRLPPAAAGRLCAAVDKRVTVTTAPAGASLRQQRADALVHLVTAEGDGAGRGVAAELVVHVTADGNHLTDGTPLTDHAVAGLLPEGFVSLLLHDAERRPVDASPRRRVPTRRQRRVVDARQATCQHPGCTATAFLQYDHVHPYDEGGPTVLANLQRLCGPHNRAKHAGAAGHGCSEEGEQVGMQNGTLMVCEPPSTRQGVW